MAHALTTARVLLTLPFAFLMARDSGGGAVLLAGLLLVLVIATDVLDGLIARRHGTASAAGRVFDHAADCLFVTCGLAAVALRGAVPAILPLLVAAAFIQYVVDSYWVHREGTLRTSGLGRWNGILYFAPLVGDVVARLLLPPLAPAVTALAWLLVVSTIVSMGERLWAVRRASRRAPASPAGGTGVRPRR